jgi:hypothetical protein
MNFSFKTLSLALLLFSSAYQLTAQNEALKILANGNVGIGTTDPKTTHNVNGTVKANSLIIGVNRIDIDGGIYMDDELVLRLDNKSNTLVGKRVGKYGKINGIGNTFVGDRAGIKVGPALDGNTAIGTFASTEKCNNAIALGYLANANYDNSIAIGYNARASAANTIRLGNTSIAKIEAHVGITLDSDKNKKEKFYLVNKESVLNKLINIPLTSWNLKGQDPLKFRHYGPMAQDFYAAFGKDKYGTIGNDTTINSQDIEGINMIGIQALADRVLKLTDENANLKKQLNKLSNIESENAFLKTSVSQLKLSIGKQGELLNKLLDKLDLVALKKDSGKSVVVK